MLEVAAEAPRFDVDLASTEMAATGLEVFEAEPQAKSAESFVMADADVEREKGDAEVEPLAVEAELASDTGDEVPAMEERADAGLVPEAIEEQQQQAQTPPNDDPWAAFLVSRESDEPLGFRFTSDRDSRLAS